ncbi:MAG: hypothetical protein ACE5EG_00665 [Thermoanaerobaculia bacterium]
MAVVVIVGAIVIWGRAALSPRASASLTRVFGGLLPVTLVSTALGRYQQGPIAILVGVALTGLMLVVLRDHLVVVYMAVFSPLRRAASEQAAGMEAELRAGPQKGRFPYYGRVWKDPHGGLVALQYSYFYAFNDWRGQGGLNFHEADWEGAMVFLRRDGERWPPDSVWLNQHHGGELRLWPPPQAADSPAEAADGRQRLAGGRLELAGSHPVLYVALGSHALYFDSGKKLLPELIRRPWLRRLVDWVFRAAKSAEAEAAAGRERAARWVPGAKREPTVDTATADDPNAGGLVIGPTLPQEMQPDRARADWTPQVVDDRSPLWIEYPGLWGLRTLLRNESGPPGPKWEREENVPRAERGAPRLRSSWEKPAGPLAGSVGVSPQR